MFAEQNERELESKHKLMISLENNMNGLKHLIETILVGFFNKNPDRLRSKYFF